MIPEAKSSNHVRDHVEAWLCSAFPKNKKLTKHLLSLYVEGDTHCMLHAPKVSWIITTMRRRRVPSQRTLFAALEQSSRLSSRWDSWVHLIMLLIICMLHLRMSVPAAAVAHAATAAANCVKFLPATRENCNNMAIYSKGAKELQKRLPLFHLSRSFRLIIFYCRLPQWQVAFPTSKAAAAPYPPAPPAPPTPPLLACLCLCPTPQVFTWLTA